MINLVANEELDDTIPSDGHLPDTLYSELGNDTMFLGRKQALESFSPAQMIGEITNIMNWASYLEVEEGWFCFSPKNANYTDFQHTVHSRQIDEPNPATKRKAAQSSFFKH